MRQKVDLVQLTVTEIEGWIKKGKYEDGDLIPSEGSLSEQLEVSRATVRDAIRILEVRGYVERIHGVGIKVNNRSLEVAISFLTDMIDRNEISFKEVLEVRRAIETKATGLAAKNGNQEYNEVFEECIGLMEKEKSTSSNHIEADYRFHETIAKASGNRLLLAIMGSYRPLIKKMIQTADNNAIGLEQENHFHRNIFECIKAQDVQGAKAMMLKHLDDTEKNLAE